MERKTAIAKYLVAGLIPGALVGAGLGLVISYFAVGGTGLSGKVFAEPSLWIATIVGCVVGAGIGALIADHRFPP